MTRTLAISGTLALVMATGCSAGSDGLTDPGDMVVDSSTILIPPPGFPVLDNAFVTQVGNGMSKLLRSADGATADAVLRNQTPGHVLVYSTITFNYPEYCLEGETRMPEPGPCRGNGPADPRDGLIASVKLSADAWASTIVGGNGVAEFHVELTRDTPLEKVNRGPGILNPLGAVIFVYVMDRGPVVAEGPLRSVQLNSLFGGCQGPPAFGTLPCKGVAIVQHLAR